MRIPGRVRDPRSDDGAAPVLSNGAVVLTGHGEAAAGDASAERAATDEPRPQGEHGLDEEEHDQYERQRAGHDYEQGLVRVKEEPEADVGVPALNFGGQPAQPSSQPPALCALCQLGKEAEGPLGVLLPFDCSTAKRQRVEVVHTMCAAWAPRAHFAGESEPGTQHGFAMVPEEVRRARMLKCMFCKRACAAMGCNVNACRRTYHLPCAMVQRGARFDSSSWQMYCPDHSHLGSSAAESDGMKEQRAAMRRLLRRMQQQPDSQTKAAEAMSAALAAAAAAVATPAKRAAAGSPAPAAGGADKRACTGGPAAGRPLSAVLPGPAAASTALQRPGAGVGAGRAALPDELQQHQQQQQPRPPVGGRDQPAGTGPTPAQAAPAPAGPSSHDREPASRPPSRQQEQRDAQAPPALAQPPEAPVQQQEQQEERRQQGRAAGEPGGSSEEAMGSGEAGEADPAMRRLPPSVRKLLRDVYGDVSPDTVRLAAAYLFREGVRSFSDVGFVDPSHFFSQVPTTRMLLNKFFVLQRERDPAATATRPAAVTLPL